MERLISQIGRLQNITSFSASNDKVPFYRGSDNRLSSISAAQAGFSGSTRKNVYTASDFGPAIGGIITLASNTSYFMMEPVTIFDRLRLVDTTAIVDETLGANALTINADIMLDAPALIRCRFNGLIIQGNGTNQLFDMTSAVNGFITVDNTVFANVNDLGTTTGCSISWNTNAMLGFNTGLVFTDGNTFIVGGLRMRSTADTTAISLAGTWVSGPLLTSVDAITGSGGHLFDIDSAISAPKIVMNVITYTGGATFDPTGLNQEDLVMKVTSTDGVPDSTIAGSMQFTGNTDATVISAIGVNGDITAFADAGGGQVTVSDATHGQSNDDFVLITSTTNYDGLYTIANATANDYEITATFVATETGTAEYGWTDVIGTATEGTVAERFSFSAGPPNELTYLDIPPTKALAIIDFTCTNGASGRIFETLLFKKPSGGIYNCVVDSRKTGEFDLRAKGLGYSTALLMNQNDIFKVMIRNTEAVENVTVIDNRINILKA